MASIYHLNQNCERAEQTTADRDHTDPWAGERGRAHPHPPLNTELVEFSPSFLLLFPHRFRVEAWVFNHGTLWRILVRGCVHRSVCLGPYVCLLYLSPCLSVFALFVYLCSRSSPACVWVSLWMHFAWCFVPVCLTVCFRVSLCLPISLHLWSAVPGGLSWCVGFVCVCPCRVDPFPLCITPICLWMEGPVIFKLGGKIDGLGDPTSPF